MKSAFLPPAVAKRTVPVFLFLLRKTRKASSEEPGHPLCGEFSVSLKNGKKSTDGKSRSHRPARPPCSLCRTGADRHGSAIQDTHAENSLQPLQIPAGDCRTPFAGDANTCRRLPKPLCRRCKALSLVVETPLQELQSPFARCRNPFAAVAKPFFLLPRPLCRRCKALSLVAETPLQSTKLFGSTGNLLFSLFTQY